MVTSMVLVGVHGGNMFPLLSPLLLSILLPAFVNNSARFVRRWWSFPSAVVLAHVGAEPLPGPRRGLRFAAAVRHLVFLFRERRPRRLRQRSVQASVFNQVLKADEGGSRGAGNCEGHGAHPC